MNIPLLREVQQHILAEPDKFRMDTWSCGTAHCIAGWICIVAGEQIINPDAAAHHQFLTNGERPWKFAGRKLGGGARTYSPLFDVTEWPHQFEDAYDEAGDYTQRAKIAAERIDHFIATNGR